MDSILSANIFSSFKYIQLSHGIANNFQSPPPPPSVKQAPCYTFWGLFVCLLMDAMTNTIEREHSSFFQQRV